MGNLRKLRRIKREKDKTKLTRRDRWTLVIGAIVVAIGFSLLFLELGGPTRGEEESVVSVLRKEPDSSGRVGWESLVVALEDGREIALATTNPDDFALGDSVRVLTERSLLIGARRYRLLGKVEDAEAPADAASTSPEPGEGEEAEEPADDPPPAPPES